ncbi:hypothetical protein L1987_80897 [Smallanthus sonchifolius]|uniref:Uncharacterized protein n=1 Tax=Smallanthus sonchifolius TaxID=185202 RepID=A0ACB8YPI5_9ASTR|nr:hypothetical protein L1987_80897 [Smallanthus sonchifolius]
MQPSLFLSSSTSNPKSDSTMEMMNHELSTLDFITQHLFDEIDCFEFLDRSSSTQSDRSSSETSFFDSHLLVSNFFDINEVNFSETEAIELPKPSMEKKPEEEQEERRYRDCRKRSRDATEVEDGVIKKERTIRIN